MSDIGREAAPASVAAIVPRATYRLQLRREFDFDAARAVLPYLHRLGISHVYCSPISTARRGSAHGYDVVDPTRINPELGGREGFVRFAEAARALGMGLLVDQVPNHMGVYGADNPWWLDVLENGQASAYAGHFDIDWHGAAGENAGRLVAPVLDAPYREVLGRGELQLAFDADGGRFALNYRANRFPLEPRGYARVLEGVDPAVPAALAEAFDALPLHSAPSASCRLERQRELQRRLARDAARDPAVRRAIEQRVARLNDPSQRDALDALISAQAFRLTQWRDAADEINYRRFFDVNNLAALCIEHEHVFEETHDAVLGLAAAGLVDGLRIDHPDGLRDPAAYFERLQQGYARRAGGPGAAARPLYVLAEKIVAATEEVPPGWAIHGTTGYHFAMLVGGLFVERRNAERLEQVWRARSGVATGFAEIVHDARQQVARTLLRPQLAQLARALRRLAMRERSTRDLSVSALGDALVELVAHLPVYRTYLDEANPPSAQDRRFIEQAVERAARRARPADAALYAFVQRCLLGEHADVEDAADAVRVAELRDFVMRFQQYSAPVAAKGVEDTAFYRYHRLVSLNEVGGDPGMFGISAHAFHQASLSRARRWPHTMLATSTHDNKRSEDVRNRISVLSEQPAAWRLGSARWRLATRGLRQRVDGEERPSRADQFLLLQTLLGTLPPEGLDANTLAGFRDRIEACMLKAASEAKLHTTWADGNEAYEASLRSFVRGVLSRPGADPLLIELEARAREVAWYGALNSLSMTLLKFASPGVPDIYQGTELIDLSLVDPDNRRPVDFGLRAGLLEGFERAFAAAEGPATLAQLATTPADGRLKLWIAWRMLALRRMRPALFLDGEYVALQLSGVQRHHAIAFARRTPAATLIAVAGRKFTALAAPGELPLGEAAWRDTAVRLPSGSCGVSARDVLSGAPVEFDGDELTLGRCFGSTTVAAILVEHEEGGAASGRSASAA